MTSHRASLAVIPGDGIGPEVVEQALKVLTAACGEQAFDLTHYDLGAQHWLRTGEVLDDETLAGLARHDAIVLGAVGAAPGSSQVPSGLLERGLLLKLRFSFDQDVNLRPARLYPGVPTPLASSVLDKGPIDFVVVREGTEGLYAGNGGTLRKGTPNEVATEVSVNTAFGVERVVRYAFDLAATRRKKVTLVHKHNVLVNAGGLWRRVVEEVARERPDVEHDYLHVDAATIMLVSEPQRFDVIVTDNLFGDILTDEAGAVTGGIGLAPSANINTAGEFPSMFEPVHGSAPDIAGRGIADPTAAISSMALLLRHLGRPADAQRIDDAVSADIAAHRTTPRSTSQIGDAIAAALG
ncbi:3-isopropylmalate dehydrogenase [Propionibacterium australiense]|uniref:3-isopropylmalate dehydrogenase n=1 Tax=Propionibacterium australiense TaxID=119981 RepID=A0A383S5V4_9ACTN|nr:3-isopropylmalate dehydrogenase [Propionibacterium australiense]RLP10611.1 3-isopropylmalate dehydrogenase [Propionibacterium australiense]SYZ32814.1 3-isopropylmalate dehydrogenase [Propionibacterium australiense]VEH91191.1 3-isopropylmalate dehydrogenase [Propionibacterium australiense]